MFNFKILYKTNVPLDIRKEFIGETHKNKELQNHKVKFPNCIYQASLAKLFICYSRSKVLGFSIYSGSITKKMTAEASCFNVLLPALLDPFLFLFFPAYFPQFYKMRVKASHLESLNCCFVQARRLLHLCCLGSSQQIGIYLITTFTS